MKSQIGLNPYLHEIKNIKDRVSSTKFRLSPTYDRERKASENK